MKLKLLFVLIFSTFILTAQTSKELADKYLTKRGELVFTFTANNFDEIEKLSRIISFDHGQDSNNPLIIKAIANKKNFKKFLAFNLPFTVDKKLNEPKKVEMYNPKIHTKGVSGKNTAYVLTFPLSTYPTYQQYADQMAAFAADHSSIAQLIDIGGTSGSSSVDPRLLFIKLSDNVTTREQEPRVMYTSSMHGDEIAGYPGMLNLIDYFITAYENVSDPDHTRVKNLLDNSEVWINPMANPEGTFYGSSTYTSVSGARRANANNIDLNRNYPDNVQGAHPDGEVYQTETLNFMALAESTHFVLSANFHGGVELVNYPFDNAFASTTTYHNEDPSGVGPYYTHPDTNWFEFISVEYATHAQNDSDALGQTSYMTTDKDSYIYPSPGVTHGAEWYQVFGGRQDYMNFYQQCREITIEISAVKTPPTTNTSANNEIIDIWNYNQEAYINLLIQGTYGFQGIVKDASTGNPIKAKITLVGHDAYGSWAETELPLGDYYRPVKAGTYDILYEADCYQSYTLTNQTIADGQTIVLPDVLLSPASAVVPTNLIASSITTTTATIGWDSTSALTYDIQYRQTGSSTWITTSSATNSLDLTGLTANTTYEFQVRGVCLTPSSYSSLANFTTLAVTCCTSNGNSTADEYIGNVTLETINNTSGVGTTSTGYSDFTALSTDLDRSAAAPSISVTKVWPASGTGPYNESISVWIDFNHDGDFFDTGEDVLISLVDQETPVIGNITIPLTATLGSTRMRVSLKYNAVPTSCESFSFGEVEDYTVNIIDSTLGIEDEILSEFVVYPNPVKNGELKLQIPREITDFNVTISNVLGQKVYENKVNSNYNNLHTVNTSSIKSGLYFVTVSTNLGKATKKIIIE